MINLNLKSIILLFLIIFITDIYSLKLDTSKPEIKSRHHLGKASIINFQKNTNNVQNNNNMHNNLHSTSATSTASTTTSGSISSNNNANSRESFFANYGHYLGKCECY